MRGLNKGEKQIVTANNFYNLDTRVQELSKKSDLAFDAETVQRKEIIEQHRRDMRSIYEQLAQMSSDLRLHTNQISTFCIDTAKIEDRLRKAEIEIIRNERSRMRDRRQEEMNGSL